MSSIKSTRIKVKSAWAEVENTCSGDQVVFTFTGRNTRDRRTTSVVEISWDIWPYVAQLVGKAWLDERERRLRTIKAIDTSLAIETVPSQP